MQEQWQQSLSRNSQGIICCSAQNLFSIFENDSNLQDIKYNELTNQIVTGAYIPWTKKDDNWSQIDLMNLNAYIESEYGIYYPQKIKDCLFAYMASKRSYNPIKTYLDSLKWDGRSRVETLLIDYMCADDNEYVRSVTRKTLVAAVARVYEPGIKFDSVLVLCGNQGIGKSTLFSKLGGRYYSDSLNMYDMKDKSAAEKMQGIWIMEMSELSGLKKVDIEVVKTFISRTDDRYRATYNQYVESHPRTGIIVGSCNNQDGFLTDATGNRRFWPVHVSKGEICSVFDLNSNDIDMIWAEAVEIYRIGEKLFLDEKISKSAEYVQQMEIETDPKQGIVDEFLANCEDRVCVIQIWCECLDKLRADINKRDAFDIERMILKNGGWVLYDGNRSGKLRFNQYGVQRTFVRKK